jgi:hypothetical protein
MAILVLMYYILWFDSRGEVEHLRVALDRQGKEISKRNFDIEELKEKYLQTQDKVMLHWLVEGFLFSFWETTEDFLIIVDYEP